jgi:hypothetical protein
MTGSAPRGGILIVIVALASGLGAGPQAMATPAYVQASRAALRAHPSPTAPVISYLTANAEVVVTDRGATWCGVQVANLKGFVACSLLGDAKLSIGAIEGKLRDAALSSRERLDWTSRAFWVSPSLRRFEDVGLAMDEALLTGTAREAEMMQGRPQRAPNAEFDEMKRQLEKGVVVERRSDAGVPAIETPEVLARHAHRATLPHVAASYFQAGDLRLVLALRPYALGDSGGPTTALADALSAEYSAAVKIRVAEPVGFGHDGPYGMWDVGAMEAAFSRDVTVNALSSTGMPTGFAIRSFVMPVGYQPCSGTSSTFQGRPINGRWSSATVGWVGKPGPATRARVSSQRLGGPGEYDKLTVDTFDLDADGVPDFSIWSGIEPARISTDTFWKAVYANVGGAWRLVAFAQEADCT